MLVDHFEIDDRETRGFLRAHRQLFVPLPDLEKAHEALADRIKAAKLAANPLYIDLDDDDSKADADKAKQELDELDAEAQGRRGPRSTGRPTSAPTARPG